ncbi:MAG: response regulator [Verrucomicrobiota bacterium]
MKNLLYLENDLQLARDVSQQLYGHFENLNVISASDGTEGMLILKKREIDILVMDLSLPEIDGLEIINHAMHDFPGLSMIVTSTSEMVLRDIGQQPLPFPFFRCLAKPFLPQNMIRDVEAALSHQPAVVIHDMSPLSVLQLAHHEGRDCKLEVMTSEGSGCFMFKDGNLVTAFLGHESGKNAVLAFLRAGNQSTRIYYATIRNNWVNVDASFNSLVLECCQLLDENQKKSEVLLKA